MTAWIDFWNSANSIYVGPGHLRAHFERLGRDLAALLPSGRPLVILDYGCGDALASDHLRAEQNTLLLYDASIEVRRRLGARLGGAKDIVILDDAGLENRPPASIDVIIASSVIQYVDRTALPGLLDRWYAWLKPGGQLIVADVIAPDAGLLGDIADLLLLASAEGFFLSAVRGLFRTYFSAYRRIRRDVGLARYRSAEFVDHLNSAGFVGEQLPINPGPNRHRSAFRGTKRQGRTGTALPNVGRSPAR